MKHDMEESLKKSHEAENLPLWREAYEKLFGPGVKLISHRQNGWHQKLGIDRTIVCIDSKTYTVDEKVRFKPYQDILLEYVSVRDTRNLSTLRPDKPGWICKDLLCNYIAYAIAPLGQCYLLPVPQLQRAWTAKGNGWIDEALHPPADISKKPRCKHVVAHNNGYDTISVAVPTDRVMSAVTQALYASFSPVCHSTEAA